MREFWLHTLQGRMILLSFIIVTVPIIVSGYILRQSAEQSLLEEKRSKLAAIAYLLDAKLPPGGYEGILRQRDKIAADKTEKIRLLNAELAAVTDEIARSSPGLGAGLYCKELDAIITYGPSEKYGYTVGWAIPFDHPGREVMENNAARVESGTLVRGNIMNSMRPLVRQGEVVGYVFVNEMTDEVEAQIQAMDRGITIATGLGLLFSIFLILGLSTRMVEDVQAIVEGLRKLRFNLHEPIIGLNGEMGEVAATINEMAAALGNARTLSENIMESMADGIIAVDNTGKITAFNPSAEELTGYSREEMIGHDFDAWLSVDLGLGQEIRQKLQAGALGLQVEYQGRHGKRWGSLSDTWLKNYQGEVIGAVVVLEDLTERKQLEEQVNRANQLATLGELMAGVAHEIRNPLTSIKGFLQYFQSAGDEEERARYLPLMMKEVDRMNRIIETLLYFSRPCSHVYMPTNLVTILQDTFLLMKNREKSQQIALFLSVPGEVPPVYIDGEQFKQVFLNLLINAVQAIEEIGNVTVTVRYLAEADEVEVTVADTGPGIPDEIKAKVFDPFFTTKQTGTGLGLAVAHRIITAQGGRIEIEDNPPGGTVIRILIPRLTHEGGTATC